MHVRGVLETCLYAADLHAAEQFYHDVLGLTVYSRDPGQHVFFRCGDSMLLVFDPHATSVGHVVINGVVLPQHGTAGAGHAALRAAAVDMEQWRARLTSFHVPIEADVHWPNGARSLYFRDPAGNSLELATPVLWELPDGPTGTGP